MRVCDKVPFEVAFLMIIKEDFVLWNPISIFTISYPFHRDEYFPDILSLSFPSIGCHQEKYEKYLIFDEVNLSPVLSGRMRGYCDDG